MKRGVQSEDIIKKNFWTLIFYCLWHLSLLDHCSEQVLQLTEPGSDQSQTVSPAPSDRWTLTAQTESPALMFGLQLCSTAAACAVSPGTPGAAASAAEQADLLAAALDCIQTSRHFSG